MSSAGRAMVFTGITQAVCGVALLIADIAGMAIFSGVSPTTYVGLTFGIVYIITGSLGVAGGKSSQSAGGARGLAIAALVMSILSILNAFALVIYSGLLLGLYGIVPFYTNDTAAGIVAAQLAFFILMCISSIVMCVFAVRVMSASSSRTTHITQVTHVAGQPGAASTGGLQVYAAPYPAGQQAPPYIHPQKI